MLAALAAVFALSHAFRTVATVMAAQMQAELALSAQQLGVFAGAFSLAFAAMQLPMGVALDLYGPRRTVSGAFLAAIGGALLSASAPSFGVLVTGQLLIGIGCAPAFLATMVFIAERYPAERFTRLSGLVLALGGLGMLITGTPLAWVVQYGSWRAGFAVLAATAALAWLAVLLLVAEPPADRRQSRESLGAALRGVGAIFAERHTLGIVVLGAVTYAAFIALRGLWVVPLLTDRHAFSLLQSGHVVLVASLAALIGPPIFGRLDPGGRTRRRWIIGGTAGLAALFAALAAGAPAWADIGIVVVTSIWSGYIVLQYADVRSAYARHLAGRALAAFNMALFFGVALVQWLSGSAASLAGANDIDPLAAAFAVIAAMLLAGALAFAWLPWPQGLRRREHG